MAHRLPDVFLPPSGDTELAQLPLAALDQIQGNVPLPPGATAIGLAAGSPARRQAAAEPAAVMDQLGEPGAGVALGRGQGRAGEKVRVRHLIQ
jgi:hypothetical protein